MASVSGSVAAEEEHLLPSRSTDHTMDTQTGQDADTQASNEHNAYPWITVTKRLNKCRQLQPHTVPIQQLPSMPSEPALRQSWPKTRLPKVPLLPAVDYKLAVHPHGVSNLSKRFLTPVNRRKQPRSATPTRKAQYHLPATDGRAVRPGVQPGEGAIRGISTGPSEETRRCGVVSLASRDLKAGTRNGQCITMTSKVVPKGKHKRSRDPELLRWKYPHKDVKASYRRVNSSSGYSPCVP
ncbi:hypothetical protein HPB51_027906 [Rhipicephalus microplus]|uniref:Uncharacterized protein n=1 Tax=Rhipicephalus microplus TaxID=6941 RepID=A0A9J6CZ13_RHIMP|nr:hypothetical protein HPB51_027906 [Rhipicephalus microplus]